MKHHSEQSDTDRTFIRGVKGEAKLGTKTMFRHWRAILNQRAKTLSNDESAIASYAEARKSFNPNMRY